MSIDQIRSLVKKPLEGQYILNGRYSRFHNDTSKIWVSKGKASIIWNSSQNRYDMLLAARVSQGNADQNEQPYVMTLVDAKILCDENGTPLDSIPFTYVISMSRERYRARSDSYFTLGNISDSNPNVLVINFKSSNTEGIFKLIKD